VIESGYLGVENYGRARGHVGDSEKKEKREERRGPGGRRQEGEIGRERERERERERQEAKGKRSIRILDCDVKGTGCRTHLYHPTSDSVSLPPPFVLFPRASGAQSIA